MPGNLEGERVLPLWEHVAELARRIRTWIYAFSFATLFFMLFPADLSFLANPIEFYTPIVAVVLQTIKDRLLPPSIQLSPGSLTGPLELYFTASIALGFAASVPVLGYEIYRFVNPALEPNERRAVYPFVTGFSVLFLAGVLFGFFVLMPFVILGTVAFFPVAGVDIPLVGASDFFNLVFFTLIVSGITFTFPVFFVLLVRFRILNTETLTRNRKYLWAMLFIMTAIITPDGSLLADAALFVPIVLLIEMAVLIGKRYEKGRLVSNPEHKPKTLICTYCKGLIDSGGVFCGRCGKSRL